MEPATSYCDVAARNQAVANLTRVELTAERQRWQPWNGRRDSSFWQSRREREERSVALAT